MRFAGSTCPHHIAHPSQLVTKHPHLLLDRAHMRTSGQTQLSKHTLNTLNTQSKRSNAATKQPSAHLEHAAEEEGEVVELGVDALLQPRHLHTTPISASGAPTLHIRTLSPQLCACCMRAHSVRCHTAPRVLPKPDGRQHSTAGATAPARSSRPWQRTRH
eukprot:476866-Rhodomonas_salina.2